MTPSKDIDRQVREIAERAAMFKIDATNTNGTFDAKCKEVLRDQGVGETPAFDQQYQELQDKYSEDIVLEYKQSPEARITSANSTSVTKDSKDPNRIGSRKHSNSIAKDYIHKNAIVNAVRKSECPRTLSGLPLMNFLHDNNLHWENGTTKTIGNSGIEIDLDNSSGIRKGVVRIKDKAKEALRERILNRFLKV